MVLVCHIFKNLPPVVHEIFPNEQLEDAKHVAEILAKRDKSEYKVFVSVDE